MLAIMESGNMLAVENISTITLGPFLNLHARSSTLYDNCSMRLAVGESCRLT
jgi:hypothetical protein